MGRRSKDTGSIYQRKDGLYVAQYRGQYKYSKDKVAARAKLHELLSRADQVKPENITVAAYMEQWLTFVQQNLKPATVKRYREANKVHIKPKLGSTKLHKVDALTVQQMYAGMLSSGLSASTVNLVHSVLSSAFKRAIKWDLLATNVITNVDAPRIARAEVEIFSTLHLPAKAVDAIRQHKCNNSFLFPSSAGTPMRYHNFIKWHWQPLTQSAGIPYKNFHTCRHYVASTLLGKGLPITAVARYLGHDEATLLRTYSHLVRGMESLVPTAMDEALG